MNERIGQHFGKQLGAERNSFAEPKVLELGLQYEELFECKNRIDCCNT